MVVDKGILKLRDQIDEMAPGRSKASDGTVGDTDHQTRDSEHNPEHPAPAGNPDYQVDAGDFTHDPASGADMAEISEAIRLSRDVRVLYVIFNRRIFSSYATAARKAWEWGPYSGSNPHDKHMHVSVKDSPHDVTTPWQIGESDMLPAQGYILHVINYRTDGLVANRPVITIPTYTNGGQSWPQVVQTNQMYLALKAADDEIDVQAIAEAVVEAIGDISQPGSVTGEQVRDIVQAVINGTHLTVVGAEL